MKRIAYCSAALIFLPIIAIADQVPEARSVQTQSIEVEPSDSAQIWPIKNGPLYLKIEQTPGWGGEPIVLVVDGVKVGTTVASFGAVFTKDCIADAAGRDLELSFVVRSHIIGDNKVVPLGEIKSFSYTDGGTSSRQIGVAKIETISGQSFSDSFYQAIYPVVLNCDGKHFLSVNALHGEAYSESSVTPGVMSDVKLGGGLFHSRLTVVSADEAQQWMGRTKQVMEQREQAANAERQAVAAENSARISRQKQIISSMAPMAKLPTGSEDSCKRLQEGNESLVADPDSSEATCQFGGTIRIEALAQYGWLIVNKTYNPSGAVTGYFIRKAR